MEYTRFTLYPYTEIRFKTRQVIICLINQVGNESDTEQSTS